MFNSVWPYLCWFFLPAPGIWPPLLDTTAVDFGEAPWFLSYRLEMPQAGSLLLLSAETDLLRSYLLTFLNWMQVLLWFRFVIFPKYACVKRLVPRMMLLKGEEIYGGGIMTGLWGYILEGDHRTLVSSPWSLLPGCHEVHGWFYHVLLPWCTASAQTQSNRANDHRLESPELWARIFSNLIMSGVHYSDEKLIETGKTTHRNNSEILFFKKLSYSQDQVKSLYLPSMPHSCVPILAPTVDSPPSSCLHCRPRCPLAVDTGGLKLTSASYWEHLHYSVGFGTYRGFSQSGFC